jgi:hypothetical protein
LWDLWWTKWHFDRSFSEQLDAVCYHSTSPVYLWTVGHIETAFQVVLSEIT